MSCPLCMGRYGAPGQLAVEGAPVGEPGQRIGQRELLQPGLRMAGGEQEIAENRRRLEGDQREHGHGQEGVLVVVDIVDRAAAAQLQCQQGYRDDDRRHHRGGQYHGAGRAVTPGDVPEPGQAQRAGGDEDERQHGHAADHVGRDRAEPGIAGGHGGEQAEIDPGAKGALGEAGRAEQHQHMARADHHVHQEEEAGIDGRVDIEGRGQEQAECLDAQADTPVFRPGAGPVNPPVHEV